MDLENQKVMRNHLIELVKVRWASQFKTYNFPKMLKNYKC